MRTTLVEDIFWTGTNPSQMLLSPGYKYERAHAFKEPEGHWTRIEIIQEWVICKASAM